MDERIYGRVTIALELFSLKLADSKYIHDCSVSDCISMWYVYLTLFCIVRPIYHPCLPFPLQPDFLYNQGNYLKIG